MMRIAPPLPPPPVHPKPPPPSAPEAPPLALIAPVTLTVPDAAISSAPSYGNFVANANPLQPGTITLTGAINASKVYVFVYELDSAAGNPNPRWSCPTCAGASGAAVRTSGHQLVVVDLKLQWKPVLNTLLGIPSAITLDSQSVERLEY